jgi:enoyl-CoA hydratase
MPAAPRIDVRLESRKRGRAGFVTVVNEAKLNTMGSALLAELARTMNAMASEPELRAVVLSGAGEKAFIGGADIGEMAGLDQAGARRFITAVHEACRSLRRMPVPVIARMDGYALGAGLEIAAAADFRVATTRSQFGMPEVKVGIPSVAEAALLPLLIGWGRTRELLLFGQTIDAKTAHAWGLVERVVDPGSLDAAVESCLAAIMTLGPNAVRLQKRLIGEWEELTPARAIEAGLSTFVEAFASDEPKRLMGEFVRRKRG